MEMQEYKIVEIIEIRLNSILLELHFHIVNTKNPSEECSIKLSISDDGETIFFSLTKKSIYEDSVNNEIYTKIVISENSADKQLFKLVGQKIEKASLGIGNTLDTNEEVIYYFKLNGEKNQFLFFNNGDDGMYSFDEGINKILFNDIYGYQWEQIKINCQLI